MHMKPSKPYLVEGSYFTTGGIQLTTLVVITTECRKDVNQTTIPSWILQPALRRGYGVKRHFQQYFSYIVAVNFIGGGNHRPVAFHRQTLSVNFVASTPPLSGVKGVFVINHFFNDIIEFAWYCFIPRNGPIQKCKRIIDYFQISQFKSTKESEQALC